MNYWLALSARSCFVGLSFMVGSESALATQVYSNDFDGTETFGGGASGALSGVITTVGVQSFPAPFAGKLLQNDTGGTEFPPPVIPGLPTTLTLSNLPAHSALDIDFTLDPDELTWLSALVMGAAATR